MTLTCNGAQRLSEHRCALLGLLATGRPVEVVIDAIQALDEAAGRRTLEEFAASGGRLTTVAEVCGASPAPPDHPCVVT